MLFGKLKSLFRSRDNKPLTVSLILNRDSCSRLLSSFAEHRLEGCEALVLIAKTPTGITVETSENLSSLEAAGMLAIAASLVAADGE